MKLSSSPLDAYFTAKPNEPTWTVQGGDPLGGPLLRLWAHFARIQANAYPGRGLEGIFEQILKAANHNMPDKPSDREELLVRATETEYVSWNMDEYLKGYSSEEIRSWKTANVFDKLDVFDVRRRAASLISNFFSELNDYREQLAKLGSLSEELDNKLQGTILALRSIQKEISGEKLS